MAECVTSKCGTTSSETIVTATDITTYLCNVSKSVQKKISIQNPKILTDIDFIWIRCFKEIVTMINIVTKTNSDHSKANFSNKTTSRLSMKQGSLFCFVLSH